MLRDKGTCVNNLPTFVTSKWNVKELNGVTTAPLTAVAQVQDHGMWFSDIVSATVKRNSK